MKKLKKFAGLILALVMVCAMGITALAEDIPEPSPDYSITIKNDTSGYEYTAYQIFGGKYSVDASGSETLTEIEWGSAIVEDESTQNQTAALNALKALNFGTTESPDQPFANCADANDIAGVLSKYTSDSDVVQKFAEVISGYVTVGTEFSADTEKKSVYNEETEEYEDVPVFVGSYTASDLYSGYYLVVSTKVPTYGVYTNYILTVVGSETLEIEPKTEIPSVDKAVSDEDANISDTVTYTLTATLPSNYADYDTYKMIFHDTMSAGLTYDESKDNMTVTVYESETDAKSGKNGTVAVNGYSKSNSDYNPGTPDEYSGGTIITIEIANTNNLVDSEGNVISVDTDSLIVVTFDAKLNDDAIIGGAGNPNEVYLEFSNNPNWDGKGTEETGSTPEDKVVTWTYELDVTKADGTDANATKLSGAEFVLYRYKTDKNGEYVYETDESGEYVYETNDAGEYVNDGDGNYVKINVKEYVIIGKETMISETTVRRNDDQKK
ncbi:MAG: isopeptide-forming domain-containing fimbrial protein [Lachnospiraceae bacterium]|nr:isopeptide-forming domain-containing fimbrial protein [Lachnospiraceae bacterium]